MHMNEIELSDLGKRLTEHFKNRAAENRSRKLEDIRRSIIQYDEIMSGFHRNHQPDLSCEAAARLYWEDLLPSFDVSGAVSRYGQVTGDFDLDYVHDGVFYALCDPAFNSYAFAAQFDNKAYYPLLFHDVPQPGVIALRINNVWLDRDYRASSYADVIRNCAAKNSFVLKYAKGSSGGLGVRFFESGDCQGLSDTLNSSQLDIVLQETQTQCAALSRIHPSSLNTIRIMTLLWNGEARALSSVLRMGINESKVDNASSGGIVCGIGDDGRLKDKAYDKYGKRYTKHPAGSDFSAIVIPGFEECKASSIALQERFPYCRMISWDWAISKNGTPVLIEANLSNGELEFHQFCNGPIFGSLTKQIITKLWNEYKQEGHRGDSNQE